MVAKTPKVMPRVPRRQCWRETAFIKHFDGVAVLLGAPGAFRSCVFKPKQAKQARFRSPGQQIAQEIPLAILQAASMV